MSEIGDIKTSASTEEAPSMPCGNCIALCYPGSFASIRGLVIESLVNGDARCRTFARTTAAAAKACSSRPSMARAERKHFPKCSSSTERLMPNRANCSLTQAANDSNIAGGPQVRTPVSSPTCPCRSPAWNSWKTKSGCSEQMMRLDSRRGTYIADATCGNLLGLSSYHGRQPTPNRPVNHSLSSILLSNVHLVHAYRPTTQTLGWIEAQIDVWGRQFDPPMRSLPTPIRWIAL